MTGARPRVPWWSHAFAFVWAMAVYVLGLAILAAGSGF